jgi:hypothetical protein
MLITRTERRPYQWRDNGRLKATGWRVECRDCGCTVEIPEECTEDEASEYLWSTKHWRERVNFWRCPSCAVQNYLAHGRVGMAQGLLDELAAEPEQEIKEL